MKTDKIAYLGCGIVGGFIIALLIFWYLIHKTDYYLSREINPFDYLSLLISIVTLCVTTYLAVRVMRELGKKDIEQRVEKDLSIELLKNFNTRLKDLIRIAQSDEEADFHFVTSEMKNLRTDMKFIADISKKHGICHDDILKSKVDSQIRDLNDALTDAGNGVVIADEKIKYDHVARSNINAIARLIQESTFDFVVSINRQ